MKTKYVALIGLSLFLTGALVQPFKPTESKEGSLPSIHTDAVRLPTTPRDQNLYYAILLMPKSYLPLLEAFKSRKIAKDIKILQADVEWNDGKMVAISRQIIIRQGNRQLEPASFAAGEKKNKDEIPTSQEDMTFKSLIPLLFLQGMAESSEMK